MRSDVGITCLQNGVATTVITVQVRVHQAVEWSAIQCVLHQHQCLRLMRHIATVYQRGRMLIGEKNVVGRQPAPLKNLKPWNVQ